MLVRLGETLTQLNRQSISYDKENDSARETNRSSSQSDSLQRQQRHERRRRLQREQQTTEAANFIALIQDWPGIIGEKLVPYTVPLKIRNQTLTVLTSHSTYSHTLSFLAPQIIGRLLERFPLYRRYLKRIDFIVDEKYFLMQRARFEKKSGLGSPENKFQMPHPYNPEYQHVRGKALELFAHIEDPELKEMILKAFLQSYFA